MSAPSGSNLNIREKILAGYEHFRAHTFPAHKDLYGQLAQGQNPRIFFITCSDSRVVPNIILSTDPGEIFECQIVGNIVPAYGDAFGGVSATLEYAVTFLKVQAIIICGHSDCGAMKAIHDSEQFSHIASIATWLRHSDSAKQIVAAQAHFQSEEETLKNLTRENVIAQLENARTHPAVAKGRRAGLALFGWVYDIGSGEVEHYDEYQRCFVPLRKSLSTHTAISL